MNTIGPYFLTPITEAFNWFTSNPFEQKAYEFKGKSLILGGSAAGNEYIEKTINSQRQKQNSEYVRLQNRFKQNPTFLDIFEDNILRLTAFAGLERFFSLRQGYPLLKSRFMFPNNNQGALQEIFNGGVFRGYFRGYCLHLFHFMSTQYHALLYSKDYSSHLLASSLLELVLHPLDTLKTRMYCDVQGAYRGYFDLFSKVSANDLYRGVGCKLAYNLVFLYHLRNIYEENTIGQMVSLPLWVMAYPLLVFKTRSQLLNSPLSLQSSDSNLLDLEKASNAARGYKQLYAGAIPFVLLNHFVCYQFVQLYSKSRQESVLDGLRHEFQETFSSPSSLKSWKNY